MGDTKHQGVIYNLETVDPEGEGLVCDVDVDGTSSAREDASLLLCVIMCDSHLARPIASLIRVEAIYSCESTTPAIARQVTSAADHPFAIGASQARSYSAITKKS